MANSSGIPNLLNSQLASAPVTLMTADDPSVVASAAQSPQWGIFDSNNAPVVVGDSVLTFEFGKEYRISDYPQEQGAFVSFNKVETPYSARLVFAQAGGDSARAGFLDALQAAAASLSLFQVCTRDIYYQSASIVHYDYKREARNGVSLLMVAVWVQEVRVTGAAKYTTAASALTNTQQPSGADPVNAGTVQTQPAPASALSTIFQ